MVDNWATFCFRHWQKWSPTTQEYLSKIDRGCSMIDCDSLFVKADIALSLLGFIQVSVRAFNVNVFCLLSCFSTYIPDVFISYYTLLILVWHNQHHGNWYCIDIVLSNWYFTDLLLLMIVCVTIYPLDYSYSLRNYLVLFDLRCY